MVGYLKNCLKDIGSSPIELIPNDVADGFKVAYGEPGVSGLDKNMGPFFTTFNELKENHLIMVNGAVTTTPNNFVKYVESLTIPGEMVYLFLILGFVRLLRFFYFT